MKLRTFLITAFILLTPCLAAAETVVPLVERPMVCPEGQGSLTFDISIGLNSTSPGRTGGVYSDLASEPRGGGLGASYGFAKGIEAGLVLPWLFSDFSKDTVQKFNMAMGGWPMFMSTTSRSHFRPINIWARFRLTDYVAVDLTALIPLEEIKSNQAGARVALPFKFVVIPGHLAVHFRPELRFGFANRKRAFDESVQISVYMNAGLTASITKALFMDLSIGYGRTVLPNPGLFVAEEYMGIPGYGASGWLPLSFTIGYSVIHSIDLFVGFTMTNLAPEGSIAPGDGKSLTIGLDYRF